MVLLSFIEKIFFELLFSSFSSFLRYGFSSSKFCSSFFGIFLISFSFSSSSKHILLLLKFEEISDSENGFAKFIPIDFLISSDSFVNFFIALAFIKEFWDSSSDI